MAELQDLIISRVRVKMLTLFIQNSQEMYYVRELTRNLKEEINAIRRELERLLGSGFLKSEQRGNRLYYQLNPSYLYLAELTQMVAKSTGLGLKIRKNRRKLGNLEFVMFSGKFVHGQQPSHEEVDLLAIGDVDANELQALVKQEEARLKREINYTIFSLAEFDFRKTRRDPFIMDILYNSRVMIIGNEVEFAHRQIPGLNS